METDLIVPQVELLQVGKSTQFVHLGRLSDTVVGQVQELKVCAKGYLPERRDLVHAQVKYEELACFGLTEFVKVAKQVLAQV